MAKVGAVEEQMRVVVVDDDANTRHFFRDALHSEKKFSFAAGFSSGSEALTAIPHLQPDFALLDLSLPDLDGIECTKRLRLLLPRLKIVIISGNRETSWFDRSLQAGALAYLLKPLDPAQLLATLRFVACRVVESIGLPPGKTRNIESALTQRERDVLSKMAEGLLYKEISDVLGISYTAVHKCQHRIFRKLHVGNRSEAIRLWLVNRNS